MNAGEDDSDLNCGSARRICVIFNPCARGEKATRFRETLLTEIGAECGLKPTCAAGEARKLAAEAVQEGFDTIVAAGGDGTLNEVLNGIGDCPNGFERARLGVLPLGTVNVFARELKIPKSLREAWKIVAEGSEIQIDLPLAEFEGLHGTEKRYFAQLAGAGLDARAVHLVSWELKKKVGYFAYVAAGLKAILSTKAKIIVVANGEALPAELVLIGNGRFYGGQIPVFRTADFTDGKLDACVFKRINWYTLLAYGMSLCRGRPARSGVERSLCGETIELRGGADAFLQLDGELVGCLPATLTITRRGLRVVAPRQERDLQVASALEQQEE